MKYVIKVAWYILMSAMVLTMFVLVTAKVFAHGEGQCLTDASGKVRLDNGWVKIIDHLSGDDLDGFAHGHRDQYYDRDGNPTGQAKGFFDIDFDGVDVADCPTSQRSPVNSCDPEPRTLKQSSPCQEISPMLRFRAGYSLSHLPVVSTMSAGRFHESWSGKKYGVKVYTFDGEWHTYDSSDDAGTAADPELGDYTGMAFYSEEKWRWWFPGFCALSIDKPLELKEGMNFVGFSRLIDGIEVDSDLFSLDEDIIGIVAEVDGVFYREGDVGENFVPFLGEIEVRDGLSDEAKVTITRSYLIFTSYATILYLSPSVRAAPMAPRKGTLATSWGAMKR